LVGPSRPASGDLWKGADGSPRPRVPAPRGPSPGRSCLGPKRGPGAGPIGLPLRCTAGPRSPALPVGAPGRRRSTAAARGPRSPYPVGLPVERGSSGSSRVLPTLRKGRRPPHDGVRAGRRPPTRFPQGNPPFIDCRCPPLRRWRRSRSSRTKTDRTWCWSTERWERRCAGADTRRTSPTATDRIGRRVSSPHVRR